MSKPSKVRSMILAVGITAITITGSFYGAGLKTETDVKKVRDIFSQSFLISPPPAFLSAAVRVLG